MATPLQYVGATTGVASNEIVIHPNSPGNDWGIPAAVTALSNLGGGTLRIARGTYNLPYPLTITGTDVRIVRDRGATFVVPTTPSTLTAVNVSAATKMWPAFVYSGCTRMEVSGGRIVQTPWTTPGTDTMGCGDFVGPNNTFLDLGHAYYYGLHRWPIFVQGYLNGTVGDWSYISEHDNVFDTCGNQDLPDGGGVRVANGVSNSAATYSSGGVPTCPHHFYSHRSRAINTQCFGWDTGNPGTGPLQHLYFDGDSGQSSVAGSGNQVVLFNLENTNLDTAVGPLYGNQHVRYTDCHAFGGYNGFAVQGNNFDVEFNQCTSDTSWNAGFLCGPVDGSSSGTVSGVRYLGCTAKNNGQGGGVPWGWAIGATVGGSSVVDDVLLQACLSLNDTGTSQAYGIGLRNGVSGATLSNVRVFDHKGDANATGAVIIDAKNAGATNTNVRLYLGQIVGTVTNNGSAGTATDDTYTTYPG